MIRNWNEMTKDQKADFVMDYLDNESSIEDLIDEVMQIINFNDMIDDWWTSDTNDTIEKEWKALSSEERIERIEDEIESWDKLALIEFLIDHMSNAELENFHAVYNEKYV